MEVFDHISQIRFFRAENRKKNIGLVPTMGALHQGHLDLVKNIQSQCDLVIVSIFVNPSQFSVGEDLDKYPRNLQSDLEKLKKLNVDVVFAPDLTQMYGEQSTFIHFDFGYLSNILCSKKRPNFMSGVGLIVSKLFNIVKPNIAIFGQKDYQQFKVIEKLVSDLNFEIKLVMAPISRDENNLALSSRNIHLRDENKIKASMIYKTLSETKKIILEDPKTLTEVEKIEKMMAEELNKNGFETEYFSILNFENLKKVNEKSTKIVILVATYLQNIRLIDNLIVDLKE